MDHRSQFNAGMMRVQHLNELIIRATDKFLSGNMVAWYHTLRSIKIIIISKLTDEERDELMKIEKKINESSSFKSLNRNNFCNNIEMYSEKLQDIMEAKDLLMPSKTDETTFA